MNWKRIFRRPSNNAKFRPKSCHFEPPVEGKVEQNKNPKTTNKNPKTTIYVLETFAAFTGSLSASFLLSTLRKKENNWTSDQKQLESTAALSTAKDSATMHIKEPLVKKAVHLEKAGHLKKAEHLKKAVHLKKASCSLREMRLANPTTGRRLYPFAHILLITQIPPIYSFLSCKKDIVPRVENRQIPKDYFADLDRDYAFERAIYLYTIMKAKSLPKDCLDEIKRLLQFASDLGHNLAQLNLGILYEAESQLKRALVLYKQAGNDGNGRACFRIGMLLLSQVIDPSRIDLFQSAIRWLEKAVELGYIQARTVLDLILISLDG